MIEFIEEKWPRHCAVGVAELSEEQKAKRNMCCYQNTHDLVHTGLNVKVIKSFLASIKKRTMERLVRMFSFASITMQLLMVLRRLGNAFLIHMFGR